MAEPAVAAVVVRNTASHDARVLRCARTLAALGYETTVIAVTSAEETAARSMAQGVPIVRLTPRAPLARAARSLRRWRSRRAAQPRAGAPRADAERHGAGLRIGPLARIYRLLRTLSYYRQGIAALRRLRPRIVHCNDYNTMWIGVAAKLLTGCSLVYDSHELWPDRNGRSEPRWWLLASEAVFLRVADRCLATSPGHADAIARRHRVAPPRVVRNITERPATNGGDDPSRAERHGPPQTLAYVGAVTEGRGLEQAIAALPHAPGIALRFIGPGREQYREQLTGLADRHGVGGRIRIEDPVPPELVVTEVAAAAAGLALIQPACLSYSLSLPNKLFEYIAAGLPILAADVPTIASFVERSGTGMVVPAGDPRAIAEAMLAIVDPERNGELRRAVAETSAQLSWELEAKLLKRAYREATATGGRAR